MITEDYVSFEVAKLLKEKGFFKDVDLRMIQNLSFYDNIGLSHNLNKWYDSLIQDKIDFVVAPTHQMAMKWLREEKRTSIIIEFDVTKRGYCPYVHQLDYDMDWVVKWRINIPMKYEEAVEVALKYTLENLI